jgi:hypothetical protein
MHLFIKMIICSCDVGYRNLAFVFVYVNELFDFASIRVIGIAKIDLFEFKGELSEKLETVCDEYVKCYDYDVVLIERQPIMGLTDVQHLVFHILKRAIFVSPCSVHKYFNIRHLTYEQRKTWMVDNANEYLHQFTEYDDLVRKHDIADAMMMIVFYVKKQMAPPVKSKFFHKIPSQTEDIDTHLLFMEYAYTK